MLVLSTLNKLLEQVITPPDIHTAVLLTPAGDLVSFVSLGPRPKDEIRVLVGLSGEVWSETRDDGLGMVDSELGRVIVLPIKAADGTDASEPLLLIAVNASEKVEWSELQLKARGLANHLAKPLSNLEGLLAITSPSPVARMGRAAR